MGRFPRQIVAAVHNAMLVTSGEHRGVVRSATALETRGGSSAPSISSSGSSRAYYLVMEPHRVVIPASLVFCDWLKSRLVQTAAVLHPA
jgi:hypothetical protein